MAQSKVNMIAAESVAAKELLDYLVKGENFSCKCYHIYGNCNDRFIKKSILVFKALLKINLPIHILPALIFKLKQMAQRPVSSIAKLAFNILRSVMFLTSFVMSIHFLQCYGSRMFPSLNQSSLNMISVFISGFGILFEQPHKRVEITYYCVPKALEGLWNFLERRNFVKTIPYQEVIVFALAMGMIGMCYGDGKNPKTLRGFSLKACKGLWDDNN